jgi:hypothetical protein
MTCLPKMTLLLCFSLIAWFGCADKGESPLSAPTDPVPAAGKLTVSKGQVAGTCEKCGLQRFNRDAVVFAPAFDPANFSGSAAVVNPFYPLEPGMVRLYSQETEEGEERFLSEVLEETRQVAGVRCTVIRDQFFFEGELFADDLNFLANDSEGNVWNFGGQCMDIEDGVVVDIMGWEAGVDGAEPGIIMPAAPQVDQLYDLGDTEGIAEILSLDETDEVAYGEFNGLLQTRNWSPYATQHGRAQVLRGRHRRDIFH